MSCLFKAKIMVIYSSTRQHCIIQIEIIHIYLTQGFHAALQFVHCLNHNG